MLLFFPIFFPINDYRKTVKYWFKLVYWLIVVTFLGKSSGKFTIYKMFFMHYSNYIILFQFVWKVRGSSTPILMLILFMVMNDDIYGLEKKCEWNFFFPWVNIKITQRIPLFCCVSPLRWSQIWMKGKWWRTRNDKNQ
jgi:hypothetical protein